MKIIVISYSLTGNNEAIAGKIAAEFKAEHIKINESKKRTMGTIIFDMIFNRTPRITITPINIEQYDMTIFVGPVWMGNTASPFRAYFKQFGQKINQYAYISICGGADGPNSKLADDLKKRLRKKPLAVIDLHIANLLPKEPKPTRKDTGVYRISDGEATCMTNAIVETLRETMTMHSL